MHIGFHEPHIGRQVRKESWLVSSFFLKYLKSWFFSDSVEFSKKADEKPQCSGYIEGLGLYFLDDQVIERSDE